MKSTTIKRDGQPPIRFTGDEIGCGSTRDHNSSRWVTVAIYRTQGGRYVAHVERVSQWQGERSTSDAASFGTAGEVIEWLRGSESGLGRASQEAVEMASGNDDQFSAVWVENVD